MRKIAESILKSASIWAMLGVILRVGGGIITLPLALRVLSTAELGLYYTFLGFTGLASLLDFGFAQTVNRSAAFAMGGAREFEAFGLPMPSTSGKPNWELLAKLVKAVQKWYQRVGVLLGLSLVIMGTLFIKDNIHDSGLPSKLVYCWWLYALTASYGFVTTYWPDLLTGIGSVYEAAKISVLSQIIGLILLIGGLFGGLGLWSYPISAFIASAVGRSMAKRSFFREAAPISCYIALGNTKEVFASLWPMAWRQGVVLIGAFLIQRGNTLVCASKLGLEQTASYGLSLNIIILIFQIAVIPLSIAWPIISRLRVQRKNSEIKKLFMTRLYSGLFLAALAIVGFGFVGNNLLHLIGSKSSLLPTSVFLFFGLVMWLETHHSQYGGLVLTENHNPFIIPAIVSGIAILCLSIVASDHWGVIGLIGAQFIVQLAWNNWWTVVRALKGLAINDR